MRAGRGVATPAGSPGRSQAAAAPTPPPWSRGAVAGRARGRRPRRPAGPPRTTGPGPAPCPSRRARRCTRRRRARPVPRPDCSRRAGSTRRPAGGEHPLPGGRLATMERAAVDVDGELGAAAACRFTGPVGAQMSSQTVTPTFTPAISYKGPDVAGHEVALLVEHRVVGQQLLAVDPGDGAVGADGRGVVEVVVGLGEADDGDRTAVGGRGELGRRLHRRGDEARLQEEVLRRVAAHHELAEDDQVDALAGRARIGLGDLVDVAGEVADHRVQLGQRHPDRSHRASLGAALPSPR